MTCANPSRALRNVMKQYKFVVAWLMITTLKVRKLIQWNDGCASVSLGRWDNLSVFIMKAPEISMFDNVTVWIRGNSLSIWWCITKTLRMHWNGHSESVKMLVSWMKTISLCVKYIWWLILSRQKWKWFLNSKASLKDWFCCHCISLDMNRVDYLSECQEKVGIVKKLLLLIILLVS